MDIFTPLIAAVAALWNEQNAEADTFQYTAMLMESGARVDQLQLP